MVKSSSCEGEPHQEELSDLVAKEVYRVLILYEDIIKERCSVSSRMGVDNTANNEVYATPLQKSIHGELTALASEFIRKLAAGAVPSFNASVREAAPLTIRKEGAHSCAVLKARDRQIDHLRIEDWAGQVAGPTYLEEHFGIPRSTLHWWQRHNDVVALRKGARKHVFPLAQFIDGRPAPGIRQVLSLIANPRPAWLWLTSPSPRLDGRIPIEMLRQDLAAEVIWAARDFSST